METTSALAPQGQNPSGQVQSLTGLRADVECNQLPKIGWPKRPGKFYVRLIIDQEVRKTLVSPRSIDHMWMDTFHFEAHNYSILKLEVYAQRKVGSSDYIGETEGRIEVLLAQRNVVRTLSRRDPNGKSGDLSCIVKFTAVSIGNSIGATELQMGDALEQGTKALEEMNSAPSPVGLLDDSVDAINSTTAQLITITKTWEPLLSRIEQFTKAMDGITEVHPYAKMAWNILSATHKIIIDQMNLDTKIQHLVETISNFFEFVHEAAPLDLSAINSQKDILACMAKQITECAYFIRDYAKNKNFWLRTAKNLLSDVDSRIEQYKERFNELRSSFQERAALQTEITVLRLLDTIKDLSVEVDLNDMPYAHGAKFNIEKECLPGTRERIIDDITNWVNSTDAPRIFLLMGVAGSGKSSIANTLSRRFDELGRLGSSFCFDRTHAAERRPDNLFSTIARDLADLDTQRKNALWKVVQGNRALRTTRSAAEQFNKFILLPTADLIAIGPILIVINALDESGEKTAREGLLSTLEREVSKLPPNFRILVTSRAEADIRDTFNNHPDALCVYMDSIERNSTDYDISLFIQSRLSKVRSLDQSLCSVWCCRLMEKAEGLFQWAATACLFIATDLSPYERLEEILSLQPQSDRQEFLDDLYRKILRNLLESQRRTVIDRFKHVLGMVLAVKEPLSLSSLETLCRSIDGHSVEILRPFGSLLSGVTDDSIPVRPLHTSFRDFLTDEGRSKEFFIDLARQDGGLALASLKTMRGLRFNICQLETSHVRNNEISDLAVRTKKAISSHLSYSCRFFSVHLGATAFADIIFRELQEFMSTRLLYWLEVLSLIKQVNIASHALLTVCQWVETNDEQVTALATDARKFVDVFGNAIWQSAPHIYLSAVPFAPKESLISKLFLPKFSNTLSISSGKSVKWPAIQMVLEGHTGGVESVTFSPDGKRIISGSSDNAIRVWDAMTGEVVSGPLQGHASGITSVAISPDGKHIVSGSSDTTIRVWDVVTGEVISGPLEGHTKVVSSVALSPNGKHIVSGSWDETIRVWDAITGEIISGPLEGHTYAIESVAFSPDGKRIVSGSADKTIRVWDVMTGEVIVGPIEYPSLSVECVMFSPDGKRIVSCDADYTIRVWDAATGDVILGPLEGHTSHVHSVAFSPDGKHIVSGASDNTIRVWDAATGEVVSGPLEGHTSNVTSVAFSPDGKRIVSGSVDCTIRVWDAASGEVASRPPEDYATSVAFSPDGKHIVAGSWDDTIRLWDAATGEVVSGPFKCHTNSVMCVAFSPDGKHIVSGSWDKTILVWDMATGEVVSGPLEGHDGGVFSVEFSHDGKHIVSGSWDNTIRVWDAATGEVVSGPLEGHTHIIKSVSFSPDGKRIVSGSADNTIRVWDAVTGDVILGPLEHADSVRSVAFSPDGRKIVSGSEDKTIRVWDAVTGEVVVGPLEGHTASVESIALSPDGKHIISGSWDDTLRLWDAVTGEAISGPLEGHASGIASVAFSPDGKRIVSSSHDKTIRVWDATTSNVTSGPLERRTNSIYSVALSPDGGPIGECTNASPQEHNHALSYSDNGIVPNQFFSGDGMGRDSFTAKMESGWMLGPSGQLLLWVPPQNRLGLWRRRSIATIGVLPTKIDFSRFKHGTDWHHVYTDDSLEQPVLQ